MKTLEPDRVYLADTRGSGFCLSGQERFFALHGLDWRDYCRNGIPFEKLEATGDTQALAMIEKAKARADGR